MSHLLCYTNRMKMKMNNTTDIRLIPITKNSFAGKALNTDDALTEHGWLDIPSEGLGLWRITDWHTFDDFGATLDTLTVQRLGETLEVFSQDEGQTFFINE